MVSIDILARAKAITPGWYYAARTTQLLFPGSAGAMLSLTVGCTVEILLKNAL